MPSKDGVNWILVTIGFVLFLVLITPGNSIVSTDVEPTNVQLEQKESSQVAYYPHDPIYIDSNGDFPFYATAGDGSPETPYIIENLSIKSNDTARACINITGTTADFVIRNCNLTGESKLDGSGVVLVDVLYGEIRNNTITNTRFGIHLGPNTVRINVTHNTCSDNDGTVGSRGILIDEYTSGITITWNTFYDNSVNAEDQQDLATDNNVFDYNYWADYGGVDANQDGIGDTVYAISGSAGHNDSHPLMFLPAPATWNETPTDQTITQYEVLYYDLNVTCPAPVSWAVNDTANFAIDENGTLVSLGTIAIGEHGLIVNVTNIYNFTIQAEFTIIVLDTTVPTWDPIPDSQYLEWGEPFRYDANATDPSGIDTYWLILDWFGNFTIDVDGVITNTTLLVLEFYGVQVGVNDTYGNMIFKTILIYNEDTTDPNWVTVPENQVIEFGESFSYDLDATDLAGIDHWWLNSTDFTIDEDGLITNATVFVTGVYGLEIYVNDTHENILSAIITITVEDTISPSWVISPENQVIEYGESFSYDLDATDLSDISHWWLNSTDFTVDSNGVIANATVLAAGVYGLEIYVNDTHGNVLSAIISVTVEAPITNTTTTTTTTTTTSATSTSTTTEGPDPLVILALVIGFGAVAVVIIVIVFLKKKT